jgi:hypothetical protein
VVKVDDDAQDLVKIAGQPQVLSLDGSRIGQPWSVLRQWLTWSIAPVDGHRALTGVAVVGVAAAIGLAVLGLPNVDLHGPLHQWGVMDPFCGGTRAARYAMQGQLGRAWTYNPLGIVAVGVAIAGTGRAVMGVVSGRWVNVRMSWSPRRRQLVLAVVVIVLVVLEVRQQSLAEMLNRPADSPPSLIGWLGAVGQWR